MFTMYRKCLDRSKKIINLKWMNSSLSHSTDRVVVSKSDMRKFMIACMEVVGTPRNHATDLADVLIEGDYRGHFSHGLNRLDMYVTDVKSKVCSVEGEPTVARETVATALVDGHNLLGPVVGNFCTELAIKKASEAGIGWIVAKGSNHYGIAGWYSIRVSKQGYLGMSFTNTSPLVVATRGKQAMLGTNPISIAAPAKGGDSFVLDMATSAVALGKIEIQERKGELMPEGWGVDNSGKVTTVPSKVVSDGALLPLGGAEHTSGYKGYGLAMMVEIFCGILSGSAYGSKIRNWKDVSSSANLGQCFVAIDPNAFSSGFEERMSDLMQECRLQIPAVGEKDVLVAGDVERRHMELCNRIGGIPYHPSQIEFVVSVLLNKYYWRRWMGGVTLWYNFEQQLW